jgi:cellulose synthase/poly-beta-1,6-N-acetylglucosamine synthase-like glycosyltransferase
MSGSAAGHIAATSPLAIGGTLLRHGLITPADLDEALARQSRTRAPLGSILIATGKISPRDLYRALAMTWGAEYVESARMDLPWHLIEKLSVDQLMSEGWVPLRTEPDGSVLVATTRRPSDALRAHIEDVIGVPVGLVVCTEKTVTGAVQDGLSADVAELATSGLWRSNPAQSARSVLDFRQKVVGGAALGSLIVAAILWPRVAISSLFLLMALGYVVSIAFKVSVCAAGARREFSQIVTAEEIAALDEASLPIYTVLVPVYREANIVAQLVDNLGRLDYPAEKLQILLLLEADDTETIQAAKRGSAPWNISFVVIPDSQPKTKPKACNVGLLMAHGEFLVIYDAEDRPEPDQLRKAVVAFRKSPEQTVCLQAALNYFNADDNILTRMFTLEYSFWFDYMLPGLDEKNLPIPLGGTSNHFRTAGLRELGGWDPFNVTEDADLGIRAAARGYRVGVIDSTTFEEANRAYGNWIRQRSRWIKGYLQTALVHSRHPLKLVQDAGLRQAAAFAMLIAGTPLAFLSVLPLYAIFVISLVVPLPWLGPLLPGWVLWASLANLLLGNALMIWISMIGAFRRRRYWLVLWAVLNPLYWVMHSVAAYKGLWQLITRPHFWEKTTHGLSPVHSSPDGVAAGTTISAAPSAAHR